MLPVAAREAPDSNLYMGLQPSQAGFPMQSSRLGEDGGGAAFVMEVKHQQMLVTGLHRSDLGASPTSEKIIPVRAE
jgi:hypothetical protein